MLYRTLLGVPLILIAIVSEVPVAQELDCKITVNYEAVAVAAGDRLQSLPDALREYMNGYRWGTDDLEEKISCTMTIFISGVKGENSYSAQIFVGSQRPILNSPRASAVARLFDDQWEFTYLTTRPLRHDPYTFDELTSLLDYYAYVVIGHDYDTYEEMSGTRYFQKAADIANLGRSTGKKGWLPSTSGYSRVQYIDEILNPKVEPLRRASYAYHFRGLDSLATSPTTAYANILAALESIGRMRRTLDPRNLVVRAFFESKYLEIADTFSQYPDRTVFIRLSSIDPEHQKTYEEHRTGKQGR